MAANNFLEDVTFDTGRKIGGWEVVRFLDQGGYGRVYEVRKGRGTTGALKAESNRVTGGSTLKLECTILSKLHEHNIVPHFAQVHAAKKHLHYSYIITTLLGLNVKALRLKQEPNDNGYRAFTVSTWIRLSIQMLHSIKALHDVGFVHRDIKPANYIMGHESDAARARSVFLIDFGLARSYAYKGVDGEWTARQGRPSAKFRGSLLYASPLAHSLHELGRRDDVISLMYTLIELHCGLPWQNEKDERAIVRKKLGMSDSTVCQNLPREIRPILASLRRLDCYQRPDYAAIFLSFKSVMNRYGVKPSDPYDWEDEYEFFPTPSPIPLWYEPEAFFDRDPIKIRSYSRDKVAPKEVIESGLKTRPDEATTVESVYILSGSNGVERGERGGRGGGSHNTLTSTVRSAYIGVTEAAPRSAYYGLNGQ